MRLKADALLKDLVHIVVLFLHLVVILSLSVFYQL